MASRHRVARVDDLDEEGARAFAQVEGVEVAVFRVDGEFHAVANHCAHQGGPLCEGELRGRHEVGDDGWDLRYDDTPRTVVCPWHGWRFDVESGRSVDDERYAVPTYEVEVEDGEVFVRR
ncbi:MAG: Rieske (2Fe-2S) protein [Halobacteriaceae archaeon]